ncbi:MAG TPA: DUF4404 family protein [Anaerolineales bacterium]|nr:DUF4404 family protein [Anaerolineales bacterium]
MTDKKLGELLEELHNELSNTEAVDEKGRELLRALNSDIQKLLDQSRDRGSDDSLLERMQDTIDHFEDTHPTLTLALSHIMNALNNAGI